MKKTLLLTLVSVLMLTKGYSQTDRLWAPAKDKNVVASKNVERPSFPDTFQLYELNIASMKQILLNAQDRFTGKKGVVISLPNMQGNLEQFEVHEASNFEPGLQAQFPEIRSYIGTGLDDKLAQLRLSISPSGIQTMVFRTDKSNEFMEPYSQDGKLYAVYNSSRVKGEIPFTCSTDDIQMFSKLKSTISESKSGSGKLLNFRLAMSCTGEYATYHGGTQALVLAAFNNTMTRVNGVFEKDLAIHMNLIPSTTAVIYLSAASDPYGNTDANYNSELQATLTAQIGDANYDVGHLVSSIGNNGNAGCIGCVCNSGKGSGYTTSTAPIGDNFDIDFVAHEMGHQFGGTHSFSNSNEGSGTNVEVGSGVTIMGYAGITSYDTHLHSIDVFHAANIAQIQANMASKTCPTETILTHGVPVVNAGANYTIPRSTPFILTGSATDPNGDPLNYTWEQNDDGAGQTNANSAARIAKPTGPNWVNYIPSTVPSRYFPKLSSVIANQATTAGLDVFAEALSSVARTLTFRLTARDNNVLGGQTGFDDTVITVNAVAGPFAVSIPNTNVSWAVGTNQTVTWAVAGTTANGVNAAYVDIYLSNDGGNTYPTLLASKVPNDGSETVTIPNNVGTTNRIMIKGNNHVFFDISNTNFTIAAPASGFAVGFNGVNGGQNKQVCQGVNAVYTIPYTTYGGFSGTTTFAVTAGLPPGAIATFSPTSISVNGNVTLTISNTNGSAPGVYSMIVTATSGTSKTVPLYLDLYSSSFGTQTLTSPADLATAVSTSTSLTWPANAVATSYDVQVATDAAFVTIVRAANVTTNSYMVTGLADATSYYWRVLPKNPSCSGTYSAAYKFTTGATVCNSVSSTNIPLAISASGTPTINSTLNIPSGATISDVNITMNVTHTWINDLTATLISPMGTQVQLYVRPCTSADIQNVTATFDDSGSAVVCGTNPGISGVVIPSQALSAFNGQSSTGTWTLRILDGFDQDGGTLNSWSLNVCSTQPLSVSQNELAGFVLYPNPNKGNFTVQFNSAESNDVTISVHDMRGRTIFNNKYSNTGMFSQNLQLDHVQSGVYLVTVQNGDSKVVKRIVVE